MHPAPAIPVLGIVIRKGQMPQAAKICTIDGEVEGNSWEIQ